MTRYRFIFKFAPLQADVITICDGFGSRWDVFGMMQFLNVAGQTKTPFGHRMQKR